MITRRVSEEVDRERRLRLGEALINGRISGKIPASAICPVCQRAFRRKASLNSITDFILWDYRLLFLKRDRFSSLFLHRQS